MEQFKQYVAEVNQTLNHLPWAAIQTMVDMLHEARVASKQVFIMGNGGSAATASHMACDLAKNTVMPGYPRLRVMALNDNMATFSACANDLGYDSVFAEQLVNFVQAGDVVVAISTSGNSANVLNAVQLAQEHGAVTIGLTGYYGGQLAEMVDLPIVIPNHCVEQIEDVHLILEHMTTVALRRAAQKEAMTLKSNGQLTPS